MVANKKIRLYEDQDLEVVWPRVANTLADERQTGLDPSVRKIVMAVLSQYVEETQASQTIKDSFNNRQVSLGTNMAIKVARILDQHQTSSGSGPAVAESFKAVPRKREPKVSAEPMGIRAPENAPQRKERGPPGVDWKAAYEFLLPTVDQLREELATTQATLLEYKAAHELHRATIAKLTAENQIYRSRFAAASSSVRES